MVPQNRFDNSPEVGLYGGPLHLTIKSVVDFPRQAHWISTGTAGQTRRISPQKSIEASQKS